MGKLDSRQVNTACQEEQKQRSRRDVPGYPACDWNESRVSHGRNVKVAQLSSLCSAPIDFCEPESFASHSAESHGTTRKRRPSDAR